MFNVWPVQLVPFSTPPPVLQGKLVLYNFRQVEDWTQIVASCGGLWFHYIELHKAACSAPVLLEACAKTLETLQFTTANGTYSKPFCVGL